MFTQQMRRKKSNAYREMHSMGSSNSSGNLQLIKLGSSIISCMDSLNNKKQQIMKTDDVSRLTTLFIEFQKLHANFTTLQHDFLDLDETNSQTERLKARCKEFLENIKVEEIEQKLQSLHKDKIKQTQRLGIMNKVQKKSGTPSTLLDNKQQIRAKLLEEQSQELKVIEKLINDIKNIAIKTSSLIYQQGVKLNISAQNVKKAGKNFKGAKQQLVQANQYEQDTNKKKLFMCLFFVIVIIVILMIILASRK